MRYTINVVFAIKLLHWLIVICSQLVIYSQLHICDPVLENLLHTRDIILSNLPSLKYVYVWLYNLIYVSVGIHLIIRIIAEILLVSLWVRFTGPQS